MSLLKIHPGSGISLEKFIGASVTQWNEYLFADGRAVGEHFTRSDSTTYIRYFIGDHLSSVSVLTDETGAVTERLSYDAWGKRRNPDGTDATGTITSATTRGFTSQEHIDDVGLINFNARLYDPAIGRFMSADPIVPAAYEGQSYNRYSYVTNRPLTLTDPTGHTDEEVCDATGCQVYQDAGSGMPCWGCSVTVVFTTGEKGVGVAEGENPADSDYNWDWGPYWGINIFWGTGDAPQGRLAVAVKVVAAEMGKPRISRSRRTIRIHARRAQSPMLQRMLFSKARLCNAQETLLQLEEQVP